ncbi:MAG: NAD-dependent epimerase/dehydratase family protein [Elusimicrobia bacterium]|nr:NAD-dependent epimerase/dehydratase family protein [Elusimicrobiota bacterium]
MDTVFLTGATGFVGANLARNLLAKGFRVRALARPGADLRNVEGLGLEVVKGDLLDRAALRAGCAGARYVFHVAADYRIWVRRPAEMYAANVEGTTSVLAAAGAAGAERIVHCSSVAAIRPPRDLTPVDEGSVYPSVDQVVGHYKKSKFLAEAAAMGLAAKGLPVVVVNPSTPIGPFDIKPTPTGEVIVNFLNRRMPSYVDTGLNLVDVRDVAEGHYLAAVKGRVGERYILGGENLTLGRILGLVAELAGMRPPSFKTPYALAYLFGMVDTARCRVFGGEPVAPLDAVRMAKCYMWYDSSKAAGELGFSAGPARRALADAIEWFRSHGYAPAGGRTGPGAVPHRAAAPSAKGERPRSEDGGPLAAADR